MRQRESLEILLGSADYTPAYPALGQAQPGKGDQKSLPNIFEISLPIPLSLFDGGGGGGG